MSKKPRKPRTGTKQAATSQKSSRAVSTADVAESMHADSMNEQQGHAAPAQATESTAAPDARVATWVADDHEPVASGQHSTRPDTPSGTPVLSERVPASTSLPPSSSVQYQSVAPPTDDIDDAWGTEETTPEPTAPRPFGIAEQPASVSTSAGEGATTSVPQTPPSTPTSRAASSSPNPAALASARSTAPTPPRFAARPSRAPSSVSPKPAPSTTETRPSRVPGSLGTASAAGEARRSAPPPKSTSESAAFAVSHTPEHDVAPVAPAGSVSAQTPSTEKNVSDTAPPAPSAPVKLEKETVSVSRFAEPEAPSVPPPPSQKRPIWAALWLLSVGAAAALGWFARPMPHPVTRSVNCDCSAARTTSELGSAPPTQTRDLSAAPSSTAARTESPPEASGAPSSTAAPIESAPATAPSGTTAADALSASPVASATEPGSTLPVFVDTESDNRVSVVVDSRPNGVRVWRRGKAIGRTPLVIQIGRGERRSYEIGSPGYGTRRLSLNGEKTEVTVNLFAPGVK